MQAAIVSRSNIGVMEKKTEATIRAQGLSFRIEGPDLI